MSWFEVDRKGLAKLLERRGKAFAVFEVVANAWDTSAKRVAITFERVAGEPKARLIVKDDDPKGFTNLAHAFTLFAESERKSKSWTRGRFNLGEKLVLAIAIEAHIASTKGSVTFTEKGRRESKSGTKTGSLVDCLLRMTKAEYDEALATVRTLIPPVGCETTLNGEKLGEPELVHTFEAELPTEIADADGNLKRSRRKTSVYVWKPRPGEVPTLYELGIPVVETGDKWHVDVCVAPSTRILTADLRYVPAGTIRKGMTLVGFDEHGVPPNGTDRARNGRRFFRSSKVLGIKMVQRPSYRLTFADGTEIVCSAAHQWLTLRGRALKWRTTEKCVATAGNRVGTLVARPLDVWNVNTDSYQAGYLAAEKLNPDALGALITTRARGSRIVKKEFLGLCDVIAIETSTRTYIAEGLASHNCQKVPLTMERDNVPPAFLRELRTLVASELFGLLTKDDANQPWVREATSDKNCDPTATKVIMDLRFGEKHVAYDPSDPEANALAVSKGYTVVHGGMMNATEWENAKSAGAILPAGKVTPSPKPYSESGDPLKLIPEEKWTPGMQNIAAYSKALGPRIIKQKVSVRFANDIAWPFNATYGSGSLTFNVGRLGYEFFNSGPTAAVNRLLIHEFGHNEEPNHLDNGFHEALCELGAALTDLALRDPGFFHEFFPEPS